MVLGALRQFEPKRVMVTTLQALSGAGYPGVASLDAVGNVVPYIGGEEEKQVDGFKNLSVVLIVSVIAIFLALTFQFKNAIKPFIVFAAVPFGAVGAMTALWIMDTPFGFMAFLGLASLIGVIVSHVIVLFDFIEDAREHGRSLEDAVIEAGIVRLMQAKDAPADFAPLTAAVAAHWSKLLPAGEVDVRAHVVRQAGAVRHGISRALTYSEPELRPILKKAGFLTRDARHVFAPDLLVGGHGGAAGEVAGGHFGALAPGVAVVQPHSARFGDVGGLGVGAGRVLAPAAHLDLHAAATSAGPAHRRPKVAHRRPTVVGKALLVDVVGLGQN